MGYGFTLSENGAGACALSISVPADESVRWAQNVISQDGILGLGSLRLHLDRPEIEDGQIASTYYLGTSGRTSEELLGLLSLIVANERELKQLQANCSKTVPTEQYTLPRRMQVQAKTQLRKALLKRYENLVELGKDLPDEPATSRQLHALRYRTGQENVLYVNISRLSKELSAAARDMHAITLDCIMTSIPSRLRSDIRTALRNAVGTRDPMKLKQRGYQDVVYILLVGIVWMTFAGVPQDANSDSDSSISDSSTSNTSSTVSLHSALHSWYCFLVSTYCPPPPASGSRSGLTCRAVNCFCPSDLHSSGEDQTPWTLTTPPDETRQNEDHVHTAYSIVKRASLLGESDTIFKDERWTKEFLKWAHGIWRAEAVTLPTSVLTSRENDDENREIQDHEEEERVLLLEIEDATIDRHSTDSKTPPSKKRKLTDQP